MATLNSPGVSVSVIDESFYTPAAPGTTPLIVVASAANKSNASATGTAQGTTTANAGTVWVITSQRDLSDTFGTPYFYTDTSGNPINGSEQNEYGLQAAYSLLGVSSLAYVVRADVDLSQLTPAATPPTGSPVAGTYWLDTANTLYGINEWNNATQTFTVKTPFVIDDSNMDIDANGMVPNSSLPLSVGSYAVYATQENQIQVWYKSTSDWVEVSQGFDGGKTVYVSPHTDVPTYTTSTNYGSVWIKTTTPGLGANFVVKYYNGSTQAWTTVPAPIYSSTANAIQNLDLVAGGLNIPVGTLFVESNYDHSTNTVADFKIWRRNSSGPTSASWATTTNTGTTATSFTIRDTVVGGGWRNTGTVINLMASSNIVAADLAAAINVSGLNVTAAYNGTTNQITFTHKFGGDIELSDSGSALSAALGDPVSSTNIFEAPAGDNFDVLITGWNPLTFQSEKSAPSTAPADGTLWFDSVYDADIMYHNGTTWVGYRDETAFPGTDPAGPLFSATEPTLQSDGSALEAGDIWVDTSVADLVGKNIYVYDGVNWNIQDVTDHHSTNGWVFADARWSGAGSDDPTTYQDSIATLLTYNYLDPDAPDPALYPRGTRLWNTRRSGNNVKKYHTGYINIYANNGENIRYENESMTDYATGRWVTVVSQNADGSGQFGRHSQRGVVVAAIKSLIDTNQSIRDTDTLNYNLIACPGYPEAIANMVALNTDRDQTAFVVGDTPFRLQPTGTALTAWGTNANLAFDNGEDGAVTYDNYLGLFYPSGLSTDNSGNTIVVPPSHMMLRTIVNSDNKAYPWYAPAGTRRGGVDNATSVGYIDSNGAFQTTALYQGLRDVLQSTNVQINPIATLPGVGLVNFGQLTREPGDNSALNRINVARLVGYLRRQLTIMAKPFLFEPNDSQTRREIKAAADSLLLELVGLRAIYDFITVCDDSNNTPARIDKNELWLDIAIEPVKAVEFIYIPLRILNTGAIASGNFGSLAA